MPKPSSCLSIVAVAKTTPNSLLGCSPPPPGDLAEAIERWAKKTKAQKNIVPVKVLFYRGDPPLFDE